MPAENAPSRFDGDECVLSGGHDLDATLGSLIDELKFRLDAITPVDVPALARLRGHGLRLVLEDQQCAHTQADGDEPGLEALLRAGIQEVGPGLCGSEKLMPSVFRDVFT